MRLILRGDKLSAKKYIGFAKARLNDMKNIMDALNLDYYRSPPYKFHDADLVVESRYGLDSAWIVGKDISFPENNGNLTATLPLLALSFQNIFNNFVTVAVTLTGGTGRSLRFTATHKIWDSSHVELYTSSAVPYSIINDSNAFTSSALFLRSTIPRISVAPSFLRNKRPIDFNIGEDVPALFSSTESLYYGIQFDWATGGFNACEMHGVVGSGTGDDALIYNSGWQIDDHNVSAEFHKYSGIGFVRSPVGADAFSNGIFPDWWIHDTGIHGNAIFLSQDATHNPIISSTKIACEVTKETIIYSGVNIGHKIYGQIT